MRKIALDYLNLLYNNSLLDDNNQYLPLQEEVKITPEQGSLLYQIAIQPNVSKTLEIGFAYGFSTIFILEALLKKGGASHIAIDPFQHQQWKSVGLHGIKKLGYKNFKWIEDYSIHALSNLIKSNQKFNFIFIDGNHRFDDILVDFYLADQLLNTGGYLILDDMWMKSTQLVTKFISSNRAYSKINQPVGNAAVFSKISDDNREWNHFIDFC